jgi:hypothetical protein
MNLYKLHDKPEDLHRHEDADKEVPAHFWDKYAYESGNKDPSDTSLKDREDALAKSPKYAYYYAEKEKGKFPEGEKAISTDGKYAYLYAKHILDGRFPAGEKAIAKNGSYSFLYAQLLGRAFPEGENAIAQSAIRSLHYAVFVLRKPFHLGEKAIANNEDALKGYINKFPERKEAIEKLKSSK